MPFRSKARRAGRSSTNGAAGRLLPNEAMVRAELGATDCLMNDHPVAAAAFTNSVQLDDNDERPPELHRRIFSHEARPRDSAFEGGESPSDSRPDVASL